MRGLSSVGQFERRAIRVSRYLAANWWILLGLVLIGPTAAYFLKLSGVHALLWQLVFLTPWLYLMIFIFWYYGMKMWARYPPWSTNDLYGSSYWLIASSVVYFGLHKEWSQGNASRPKNSPKKLRLL